VRRISTRAHVEQGRGGGERRPVMGRHGAGSGRRAHDGVRCLVSPATSFAQGAGSSTPGRWRDPLELGPWLPRAPCHAHTRGARRLVAGELHPGCRNLHPSAGSSAPRHRRAPPQLPRARALAAASSSLRPQHGELDPSLHRRTSASSAPCTGREAHPRSPCPWVVAAAFRKKNADVWIRTRGQGNWWFS
jgi:hypothetical protein